MQKFKLKCLVLLLGFLLPTICDANVTYSTDGHSNILIKERIVQSIPKGSTIQATINGHELTVVFTENLGQVAVEVSSASGTSVHYSLTPTPNGVQVYTNNAQNKGVSVT